MTGSGEPAAALLLDNLVKAAARGEGGWNDPITRGELYEALIKSVPAPEPETSSERLRNQARTIEKLRADLASAQDVIDAVAGLERRWARLPASAEMTAWQTWHELRRVLLDHEVARG